MNIQLENISKRYGFEWIFKQVNYQFEANKKYAIVGPNGSGKSTLLKIISGGLVPTSGEIHFSIIHQRVTDLEQASKEIAFAAPYISLLDDFNLEEMYTFHSSFKKMKVDSLQQFLSKLNIAAIYDVDTRAIVRHIRSHGAMNALVATDSSDMPTLKAYLSKVPNMNGLELASKVSTNVIYDFGNPSAKIKIAVLDFGIKKSILVQLAKYDYNIRVFPAHSTFLEINNWNPDAYFLSNGPGDPAPMDYAIQTAKLILESKKPVFGICLGHQLLGLAMGISTIKMFHGHRGINHPVKNLQTGLSEITSQNHGFSLDMEQVNKQSSTIELTHINLNDQSVEGIRHKTNPVFSVQYHPEAGPGPHDSRYLFRQFSDSIHQSIGTN